MFIKKLLKRTEYEDRVPNDHSKLLAEIEKVKNQLECANTMFNYTTDPKLIESAIHEINSCQLRYDFLVREAKEKGLIRR